MYFFVAICALSVAAAEEEEEAARTDGGVFEEDERVKNGRRFVSAANMWNRARACRGSDRGCARRVEKGYKVKIKRGDARRAQVSHHFHHRVIILETMMKTAFFALLLSSIRSSVAHVAIGHHRPSKVNTPRTEESYTYYVVMCVVLCRACICIKNGCIHWRQTLNPPARAKITFWFRVDFKICTQAWGRSSR